ncbi:MAG: peptide chain release factor N(5)-glutamine methyltransferase [Methylovulum sp.]|nr:peptide chain release factor N(5)-glutamine methyltransferase [Methylovulum sp.]
MTAIQSALKEAACILSENPESPTLDAEILLCLVLDKPRSYLRAWCDKELEAIQLSRFQSLIQQRHQGIPIAYLTGGREFWSREFIVSADVLIPRPDTELLIELSLKLIPTDRPTAIIDLGTGSGIIAITLAAQYPHAQVFATDISPEALAIAKLNADKHQVGTVQFYQSNWLADVPDTQFDLIISNPPYLDEDDIHLQQGDVRFEPRSALIAAEQGLRDIRTIAETAHHRLKFGGHLLIEHGYNQQQAVQCVFKHFGYDDIQTHTDLSGHPRVTVGCTKAPGHED